MTPSTTTGPTDDPRRAVAQELLQRLGPAASRYTPQQLAQAASTILSRRQQAAQPPATAALPQSGLPLDTGTAQDATAQVTHGRPSGILPEVTQVAQGIGEMFGHMANAVRFDLGLNPTTAETQGMGAAGTLNRGGPAVLAAAKAQAVDSLPPDQKASILQGQALWATMAAGPLLGRILPVVPGVTNKATQYLVGNALGGAVYGAIAPTPEGQTKGQAILHSAGQFGLAGSAVDLAAAGVSGAIPWKEPITGFLPPTKEAAVAQGGQLANELAAAKLRPGEALTAKPIPRSATNDEIQHTALEVTGPPPPPSKIDPNQPTLADMTGANTWSKAVDQAAKKQAIDVGVMHTPTVESATPEMQAAVKETVENPPTATVGDLAGRAFTTPDPDAHFAAHIGDHIDIPPETQLPPLTGEPKPGDLPSLNIAQSLQFLKTSQTHLDGIVQAAKAARGQATQETLSRLGGQAGFAARPLVNALGGFGISTIGDQVEDEHPALGSLLHTVGRLMETSAVLSLPGEFWARKNVLSRAISSLDATVALTQPGAKEAVGQIQNLLTYHGTQAEMLRRDLARVFPDEASQRALAYIGGPNWNQNAHWASLNPTQQQWATRIVTELHRDLAGVANAAGVMGAARDHYMPLAFNRKYYEESFGGNPANITPGLSQTGGWAKQRVFPDLATAEDWVKSKGLDPEQVLNHNGPELVVSHFRSVMRALDNKALTNAMLHLGYLQPKEEIIGGTTQFTPNMPGWRDVNVPGWQDHRAPNAVATLLENAARGPIPTSGLGQAYDLVSGLATRAVIYNRYIHGLNLVRANLFAGVGWDGYSAAQKALNNNDPAILEAAQHGVQALRGQIVPRAAEAIDDLLAAGGHKDLTVKALQAARGFIAQGDHVQDMIGSTALAVWNKERAKFIEAHPEILPGSPAWQTNMDRIGRYANDVAGRVPSFFRSPTAAKLMNRVFLAPQWLESRWNLMQKGLIDDPAKVLNGGLPASDALYGKFKLRQLAIAAAGTAALSYALSGKGPTFNPQTSKFYANTGMQDDRGNDIGFDPWGWGQDELQLFGSQSPLWPVAYLNRKTSPLVNIATELKYGRDFRGRELSPAEAVENAAANLGGIAQGLEIGAKTALNASQGVQPTVSGVVRGVAATVGLGGFAGLQSDQQVMLSAQAAKILQQYGVPATGERVWNLTRLMLSDARRTGGRSNFGYLSGSYVANEQRQLQGAHPYTWLWNHLTAGFQNLVQ